MALSIEEVLYREGKYIGPTVGISMRPMLKTGRDTVVIEAKGEERLKVLDVALYKRGENYVLHRVIALTKDGYIIRGDNCYGDEYVKEECILGILTEYFRKNRHIYCTDAKYLRYAKRRVKNYPRRRLTKRIVGKCKSLVKKVLGRK